MIIQLLPMYNPQWALETFSVDGDSLYINGTQYHLPSIGDEYDELWFCGQPVLLDGVWFVKILYPLQELPTSQIKTIPPISVTSGAIDLGGFVV